MYSIGCAIMISIILDKQSANLAAIYMPNELG